MAFTSMEASAALALNEAPGGFTATTTLPHARLPSASIAQAYRVEFPCLLGHVWAWAHVLHGCTAVWQDNAWKAPERT